MEKIAPQRETQNLFDALQNGFAPESTTFINWELVTKRGNTAIRDSERKNLFDRIAEAHRNHIDFVIIIDEEHSNNTSKAREIIDAFAAKNIIRVSANAIQNKKYEFYEIDEQDVIDAGLITKAIYVNEGIERIQMSAMIMTFFSILLTPSAEESLPGIKHSEKTFGRSC